MLEWECFVVAHISLSTPLPLLWVSLINSLASQVGLWWNYLRFVGGAL